VGKVLREEVENDSVNIAPGGAPDLRESVGYDDKDSIGRDHHDAACHINDQKDENKPRGILLKLHHEVLNFVSVENLHETDQKQDVPDNNDGQNVDAESVGESSGV